MFKIVRNDMLAAQVHRLVVEAPRVAAARKAGQFVIVRLDEDHERIPLTIADADAQAGTITLIVQAAGASTREIVALPSPRIVQRRSAGAFASGPVLSPTGSILPSTVVSTTPGSPRTTRTEPSNAVRVCGAPEATSMTTGGRAA